MTRADQDNSEATLLKYAWEVALTLTYGDGARFMIPVDCDGAAFAIFVAIAISGVFIRMNSPLRLDRFAIRLIHPVSHLATA